MPRWAIGSMCARLAGYRRRWTRCQKGAAPSTCPRDAMRSRGRFRTLAGATPVYRGGAGQRAGPTNTAGEPLLQIWRGGLWWPTCE